MITALEGQSMPTYAYAYNNPLRYADPDGLKPGDRFSGRWAQNRAATDAFDFINRRSIREGREWGGLICRDLATGEFFATDPKQGEKTKCQPASSPCPEGSVRVAEYHTHGGGYDWSRFFHENPDLNIFDGPGAFNGYDYYKYKTGKYGDTSYLATQSGHYYKFYSSTGRETRLWP